MRLIQTTWKCLGLVFFFHKWFITSILLVESIQRRGFLQVIQLSSFGFVKMRLSSTDTTPKALASLVRLGSAELSELPWLGRCAPSSGNWTLKLDRIRKIFGEGRLSTSKVLHILTCKVHYVKPLSIWRWWRWLSESGSVELFTEVFDIRLKRLN